MGEGDAVSAIDFGISITHALSATNTMPAWPNPNSTTEQRRKASLKEWKMLNLDPTRHPSKLQAFNSILILLLAASARVC
ncbi:putative sodium/chloride dependent transporter [Sesbania bispinosa]|nr:putative sodium/chloride dependent transporter [Sesbania bispinosa]